jgi:CDP-glucose 4,6-dehydratase
LITGHTGFKGSWLSLWLHSLGAEVFGYALDPLSTPNLFTLASIADLIEDTRADILSYNSLENIVARTQPEIVFHLAAQPIVRQAYREPKYTIDVNVGGTVNLLEVLRGCKSVRAIIVITSDKCYENREWVHAYRETDRLGGHDPYSASKAAADIIASAYARSFFQPAGVNLATARAGNVIGGGDWATDRIIPDINRKIREEKPVPVRNPDSIRPWQHVLEPLFGYLLLGAYLISSESNRSLFSGAWNFGPLPGNCRPVCELVEKFLAEYGSGTWEDASPDQKNAPHEAQLLTLAWDKSYHNLGWHPRWEFEETVRRTCNWYLKQAEGVSPRHLCLNEIKDYL